MTEILVNLGAGLVAACAPLNLGMIVLGLVIGILAGALPGITMVNSIVLVLPFTYLMGIVPALLLMIGVYCGGVFGGSITGPGQVFQIGSGKTILTGNSTYSGPTFVNNGTLSVNGSMLDRGGPAVIR